MGSLEYIDSFTNSNTALNEFKREVASFDVKMSDAEWSHLSDVIQVKTARKKEVIFSQTQLCRHVIYLMSGITATIYLYDDKEVVTRFFQKGNFSTNIVSAESKSLASDILVAITDVEYLLLPFDFFLDSFFHSNTFGLFVRKKLMGMIIENKKNTTIKTINDTEIKYQFLEENYPDILRHTPSKYIAKYLGVTPEGYSRFLSNRRLSEYNSM
ncbi:MAG: hypothetical protein AAGF85_13985 [Bacteroidota bacterium]